jgi:hypothetical protein
MAPFPDFVTDHNRGSSEEKEGRGEEGRRRKT